MKRPRVTVQRDEINPEPITIIARDIMSISDAMRKIDKLALSRIALVALIHDQTKISKRTINVVLDSIRDLEKTWLKKQEAKA
jgi:hypothetical protein